MVKKFSIFILVCLLALLTWMCINVFNFTSKQLDVTEIPTYNINHKKAINNFSESLTYRTISIADSWNIDILPFIHFNEFLKRTYPLTFENLEERIFSDHSILLKWEGNNSVPRNPILLMAHLDVVPALNEELWIEKPFSGIDKSGFIWGRGAIDQKSSVISILEGIE